MGVGVGVVGDRRGAANREDRGGDRGVGEGGSRLCAN